MKLYKLPIVLYEPCEDTNDMYMAEAPLFPGCRAWAETPSQAIEYIQGVAEAFFESYIELEQPLPVGLQSLRHESHGAVVYGEVIVAASEMPNEILSS